MDEFMVYLLFLKKEPECFIETKLDLSKDPEVPKNLDVMGPLGKLWPTLEQENK